jgi:hypothetical protein
MENVIGIRILLMGTEEGDNDFSFGIYNIKALTIDWKG